MEILKFIKEYWVLITFFVGEIGVLWIFAKYIFEAIKGLLRHAILSVYDACKVERKITRYQLQNVHFLYAIYKKLGGNSFVDEIMEEIKDFKIID